MQKFQFSLQCALDYRNAQFEMQQACLEGLFSELQQLDEQQTVLTTARVEEDRIVKSQASPLALSLVALDAFTRHCTARRTEIERKRIDCLSRIREQQGRVIEARRNRELLEKMRERRKSDWQHGVQKETDELTSELHLARWARENRR